MDTEQFGQLMSSIGEVKNEQVSLRRELLGNGQPGRIQVIETDISDLKLEQGSLRTAAAVTVWKFGTLSALAGSAVTLGAQWLGRHIFHA